MLIYFLSINLVTFLAFAWDKAKAEHKQRRMSEYTLLSLSILGGAAGSLLGMYLCRHKTRKPLFFVGEPLLLAVQVGFLLWWFRIH